MKHMRIGILTSGGDCPGLNAVVRGVTKAAEELGWQVIGFLDGFEGLLPPAQYIVLDHTRTHGIMQQGGTILGTTSRGHFIAKVGAGQRAQVPAEIIEKARRTMADLEIDGLIVVGGDGSLTTALQLQEAGFSIIGVPKTIDNDLEATSMTFGFDSAVACVADALDRLHSTAMSHKRLMVLEVMGRHAGWIATHSGMAGGADCILVPERKFNVDEVCALIRKRIDRGKEFAIVVVAEGATPDETHQVMTKPGHIDEFGHAQLGGIGEWLGGQIETRTGIETRVTVLGHVQRGGTPTAYDRVLATRFGLKAVELIRDKQFGYMASLRGTEIVAVPIEEALSQKLLDPKVFDDASVFFG